MDIASDLQKMEKSVLSAPMLAISLWQWPVASDCDCPHTPLRKRGGVQKSMGNRVPWKIGMLIYLPGVSRPLISPQKEAV